MNNKNKFDLHAQGTIEYLVILAVVVIIALVAVMIITGNVQFGQDSQDSSSKIAANSRAGINVTSAYISLDGNIILTLKNKSNENISINQISLDNNSYSEQYCIDNDLGLNDEKVFIIKTSETCVNGEKRKGELKLNITNENFTKEELITVDLECSNITVNVNPVSSQSDGLCD
ncbi:MAG: hypothetical protein PHQ98_02625 [Candidatus ainarchaeum sp.]|nr:hypothetical protein [Candidatus ainarchaeum sp.]